MSAVSRIRAGSVVLALLASVLAVVVSPAPAVAGPAPLVPGAFVSMDPARVLDTRSGVGAPRGAVAPGASLTVKIAGAGGVPQDDIGAVFLTLTVTQPAAAGYLSVRPYGSAPTGTSNLNFAAGQTVANGVVVPLGSDGSIVVANAGGRTQVVADVTGYTRSGAANRPGSTVAISPQRLLDTRTGKGAARGPLVAGHDLTVDVTGAAGVPPGGVGSVLLNLTATGTRSSGYLTVREAGTSNRGTSNVNWDRAGQTVAALALVPLGEDGRVTVTDGSGAAVDVVADVVGFVLAGRPADTGTVAAITPFRSVDTRGDAAGPVATGAPRSFPVAATPGFPSGTTPPVAAAVVTVTVTRTTASGYLTVWSGDGARPTASTANWAGAGRTVASLVVVPLAGHRSFSVAVTGGRADVLVDVSAYVLLDPSGAPPAVLPGVAAGFQQDAAHDGHAAGSLPGDMTRAWDLDLDSHARTGEQYRNLSAPVVADGGVWLTAERFQGEANVGTDLFSLDLDGSLRQSPIPLSDGGQAWLTWDDGRLFVVTSGATVTAIGTRSDRSNWGRTLPEPGESAPAAYGGRLYLAVHGTLFALDQDNGNIVWQRSVPWGGSAPVVSVDASGVYLTGAVNNPAQAYSLDGALRWSTSISGTADGQGIGALHHGQLWIVAGFDQQVDGAVRAAATGQQLRGWYSEQPPAFAQSLVVMVREGLLVASSELGAGGGWITPADDTDNTGVPVTTDDTVYVTAADGTVRGYSLATGTMTWSARTPVVVPPQVFGRWEYGIGPVVGAGMLLVPNGSHLTAFG